MKSRNRVFLVLFFFFQLSLNGFPQSIIATVVGDGTIGFGGDGGPATEARIATPKGVVLDSSGNLYIADATNGRVRKVTPAGVITTVAGGGFNRDGGLATSAYIGIPSGVAVDLSGNLYIADSWDSRIYKVSSAGIITTVAGREAYGFSGDGGQATSAMLNRPEGIEVDSAGNLYIADQNNHRIRKVSPAGIITTVAGNGTCGYSGDGDMATSASLCNPSGVAVDPADDLYIADPGNGRIRKVSRDGVITTIAGNGKLGFSGDGGQATSATLYGPNSVAVDSAGDLYIADSVNCRIRKVSPDGVITTVAGNGLCFGYAGLATSAGLCFPVDVALDSADRLYIADLWGSRIYRISSAIFFPQVAVGGGYSTLFTITNTGATAASGNLILRSAGGALLTVSATLTDSSGVTQPASTGSAFALTIPSGGTVFLSATGLTPSHPIETGWGQLESGGGSLDAVAIYEYVVGTTMQTTVGVLHSQLVQYATMPVQNDSSQGKQMVYAIANPSSRTISVKLALVDQGGTVVDDTVTVTLLPGEQKASYVWQSLGRTSFRGSLVFRGQAGATFIAVALLYSRDLLTATPFIAGKAPGVPN